MSELDTAQFIATIAPIMTGITTGSDGMRLKLDIPETYMHEGAKLLTMRGKLLKVTIEVQEQGDSTPQKKANY